MSACCSSYSDTAGAHFGEARARRDLENYRRNGPGPTARLLRDLLAEANAINGSLLDVGSGIGGLTFELLDRGVDRAVAVDASGAFLAAAAQEAARRDRARVVEFLQADFLDVASRIPNATIVALDRVVCCYPSYELLLAASVQHAERAFAYSYPRDAWYVSAAIGFENRLRWARRNAFRAFVHPVDRMTRVIERAGFKLAARRHGWQWCADLWTR